MENNQPTTEKAGLSVFAFILGIFGLILMLFHCLCDVKAIAAAMGTWAPTLSGNPVLYWVIFGIAAACIIISVWIGDVLKKRNQGIKSLVNVIRCFVWIFLAMIIISIALRFLLI